MSIKIDLESKSMLDITKQMEYYLLDDNLQKDSFFYQKISSDPNGYVDIELFMQCPKISKSQWTRDDLVNGISKSELIELDDTKMRVRRKRDLRLPEMKFLNKKRKKEVSQKCIEEEEEKEIDGPTNDPIVLLVTAQNSINIQWKYILNKFQASNTQLEVVYGRFKDKLGHVVVLVKSNEELKFTEELTIEEHKLNISKAKGDDLIDFWKYHGSHLELCVNKRRNTQIKKQLFKKTRSLSKPIELGGKFYNDINRVKAKAREILLHNKDNAPLQGADNDFVLDLLKYHHNYNQKSKDMEYITTGKQVKYSRHSKCFYIIKTNNNKEDFSIYKCIEVIEAK